MPALAGAANLALFVKLVSPYISFDSKKKTFLVLSKRGQGFAPREQLHYLLQGKGTVNNEADLDSEAWNRPNEQAALLLFVTYPNSDHIASAISNNTLYTKQENKSRFTQFALQTNKLPAEFQALLFSIATALSVTCPSLPAAIVIGVESIVLEML